jgi:hypothetical protein
LSNIIEQMTPEERFERIEEKHLALAESVQLLTHDVHALQARQQAFQIQQERQDARERQLRMALLNGIAAFLQGLTEPGDTEPGEPAHG